MVAVAHQVEHRIVTPEVAGSRPVSHPIIVSSSPSAACDSAPSTDGAAPAASTEALMAIGRGKKRGNPCPGTMCFRPGS